MQYFGFGMEIIQSETNACFYIQETEYTETKPIYTLALNFKKDRYVSARE